MESVRSAHERFGPGLRRFFEARVGRDRGAEELYQETWAALWESVRAGRYDPSRAALSTFLYAIATKIWLRYRRGHAAGARRAAGVIDDLAERALSRAAGPGDEAGLAELIERVVRCVSGESGGLSEDERAVLLAVARGASDRDLAKLLGVAPSTAHARRATAFAKLRGMLGVGEGRG